VPSPHDDLALSRQVFRSHAELPIRIRLVRAPFPRQAHGVIVEQGFGTGRGPIIIALSAGIITAFNPCGFAMLPAYVSYFVGQTAPGAEQPPLAKRLLRAALTGGVVTLGFMTVFGAMGIVATEFLSRITSVVPFISIGVGIVLAILGVAMLRGYELKLRLPRMQSARKGSSMASMYVYGVSYAVVSLSCGFAGFLSTVISASNEGSFFDSMKVYFAFTSGMGLVLILLSFAVALAQQGFVRGMKKVLPYVNRISGAMLILAGLYVSYYGYYSYRITRGLSVAAGPVAWVDSWSTAILRRVNKLSATTLVVLLLTLAGVVVASLIVSRTKVRRHHQRGNDAPIASSVPAATTTVAQTTGES
jgi:cytochrome c-type biogenesis protein